MFITFENSKGEERLIGETNNINEAYKKIFSFLKKKNYKSYYTRQWQIDDNTIKIDVGSHTEFFYLHS